MTASVQPSHTRFAHISDLHVLDLEGVTVRRFMNKRITGLANLIGVRNDAHPVARAEALVARLVELLDDEAVDHVLCTGDLTNLSLDSEFARARAVLEPLIARKALSVVPGNHDVYTRGSARAARFEHVFGDVLWPDTPKESRAYPFRHEVGSAVVLGLCSAVPRAPLMATGHVAEHQLARLRAALASVTDRFPIVLVHHNLHDRSARKNAMHGLQNRQAVLDACVEGGAGLVLHGHTHVAHRFEHRGVPIIGCGSSTWASRHPDHIARFNVYTITQVSRRRPPELTGVTVHRWDERAQRFLPAA